MSSACDVVEGERPCVSSARVRAEGDVISSPSARWPVASVSSRICDAVEGERSLSSGACAGAAAFERRADVRSQLALWCAVRPLGNCWPAAEARRLRVPAVDTEKRLGARAFEKRFSVKPRKRESERAANATTAEIGEECAPGATLDVLLMVGVAGMAYPGDNRSGAPPWTISAWTDSIPQGNDVRNTSLSEERGVIGARRGRSVYRDRIRWA